MNVQDARNAFIQKLHSYLSEHYSNAPKLAITMDCTGRIADIVLYIHCTNDQWNLVAIDIVNKVLEDKLREAFIITTLSEEEKLPQSCITCFFVDVEAKYNFKPFIKTLQKNIF